jgi:hypothetical protein
MTRGGDLGMSGYLRHGGEVHAGIAQRANERAAEIVRAEGHHTGGLRAAVQNPGHCFITESTPLEVAGLAQRQEERSRCVPSHGKHGGIAPAGGAHILCTGLKAEVVIINPLREHVFRYSLEHSCEIEYGWSGGSRALR